MEQAAHTLKSTVLIFGAKPAGEAALRLEMLAGASNLAEADEAWSCLQREIGRLLPALAEWAGPVDGEALH